MSYFTRRGVKWYYRLVSSGEGDKNALFGREDRSTLAGRLLICYVNIKGDRGFSIFSRKRFFAYQKKFKLEERTFFEVVLGELPQLPHFDIDLTEPGLDMTLLQSYNTLVTALKEAIIATVNKKRSSLEIEPDQIKEYTSHENVDPLDIKKCSGHILVCGYKHSDNLNAGGFYKEVMKNLDHPCKGAVDKVVYKSIQQFRAIWSQKPNSGRPKLLADVDKQLDKYEIYLESLISNVDDCVELPSFCDPSEKKANREPDTTVEIKSWMLREADKLLKKSVKPWVYEYSKTEANMIIYIRKRPSRCEACKRIHENENPFVFIKNGYVYFNCRRNDKNVKCGLLPSIASGKRGQVNKALALDCAKDLNCVRSRTRSETSQSKDQESKSDDTKTTRKVASEQVEIASSDSSADESSSSDSDSSSDSEDSDSEKETKRPQGKLVSYTKLAQNVVIKPDKEDKPRASVAFVTNYAAIPMPTTASKQSQDKPVKKRTKRPKITFRPEPVYKKKSATSSVTNALLNSFLDK